MSEGKRLRLLKVVVQPVFVVDDGENLTEVQTQPIVVAPENWPTYPTTGFADAVAGLQAQIDGTAEEADGL